MWQGVYAGDTSNVVWMKYTQDIVRVQFSKDGSKILTVGSGSGGIIIFDTKTGDQIKQLSGNGGYSEDGTIIYSSHFNDVDHYIEIFDANTYQSIRKIDLPEIIPDIVGWYGALLSPDGQTFAVGGEKDMYFVDYQTGSIKKYLFRFGNEPRQVNIESYLFTKDSKYLIITMGDPVKGAWGELMYINTQNYQMDYRYDKRPVQLSISEDGTMICFTAYDEPGKAVIIMNTQTHMIINSIPGDASHITSMAFSPDNKFIAVSNYNDYKTILYQTDNVNIVNSYKPGWAFVTLAVSNYNGNFYMVGAVGQKLQLFDFIVTDVPINPTKTEIIFPNPAFDNISISLTNSDLSNPTISIYNSLGVEMKRYDNTELSEKSSINLTTDEFPSGIYYCTLNSGTNKITKSFVVIR